MVLLRQADYGHQRKGLYPQSLKTQKLPSSPLIADVTAVERSRAPAMIPYILYRNLNAWVSYQTAINNIVLAVKGW